MERGSTFSLLQRKKKGFWTGGSDRPMANEVVSRCEVKTRDEGLIGPEKKRTRRVRRQGGRPCGKHPMALVRKKKVARTARRRRGETREDLKPWKGGGRPGHYGISRGAYDRPLDGSTGRSRQPTRGDKLRRQKRKRKGTRQRRGCPKTKKNGPRAGAKAGEKEALLAGERESKRGDAWYERGNGRAEMGANRNLTA